MPSIISFALLECSMSSFWWINLLSLWVLLDLHSANLYEIQTVMITLCKLKSVYWHDQTRQSLDHHYLSWIFHIFGFCWLGSIRTYGGPNLSDCLTSLLGAWLMPFWNNFAKILGTNNGESDLSPHQVRVRRITQLP